MVFLDYFQWKSMSEYLVSPTTRNGSSLSFMLILFILTLILNRDLCLGGAGQFSIWGKLFFFSCLVFLLSEERKENMQGEIIAYSGVQK